MDDRILIVDDDAEILTCLKSFLEMNDFDKVETVETPKEAIALIKTHKFDILLLDINMPEMNGIELLREVKERDFSAQVIMMTGYTSFDKTMKSLQYGACDYMLKPFNLEELLETIKESSKRIARWRKAASESIDLMGK